MPGDLSLGQESITGSTAISADNLAAVEASAQTNPYIDSIRLYELLSV